MRAAPACGSGCGTGSRGGCRPQRGALPPRRRPEPRQRPQQRCSLWPLPGQQCHRWRLPELPPPPQLPRGGWPAPGLRQKELPRAPAGPAAPTQTALPTAAETRPRPPASADQRPPGWALEWPAARERGGRWGWGVPPGWLQAREWPRAGLHQGCPCRRAQRGPRWRVEQRGAPRTSA